MTARAALLLLAAVGCGSTTYARPDSPEAQAWLEHHASSDVEVEVASGRADHPPDRAEVLIDARSPTDIRLTARDTSVLAIERVHRVVQVHHGLGALEGAAIGLGAGALLGLIYGGTRTLSPYERSGDCALVCSQGDAATLAALMFGALGLVTGTATGAIVGTRDVLDLR